MRDEDDIKGVLVGISKDLSYLKLRMDEKIELYDKHLAEAQGNRDKITELEAYQSIMWKFILGAIAGICGAWFKIINGSNS